MHLSEQVDASDEAVISSERSLAERAAGMRETVASSSRVLRKATPRFSITPEPKNANLVKPLKTNTRTKADDEIVVSAA